MSGSEVERLMSMNIDTERFIVEVQSRIPIWDTTSEDYSNRELKKRSWDELVDIFMNKEAASAAERYEYGRLLQRKWKSLRDCFSRECQRLNKLKTGRAVARKTQYIYFNKLAFLHKVVKNKETNDNLIPTETFSNTEVSTDEISNDLESYLEAAYSDSSEVNVEQPSKRIKLMPDVELISNALQASIQAIDDREKLKEEDDDKLFLMSLLKPLKRIPEHMRLSVRVELLQVIEKATQKSMDGQFLLNH